MSRRESEDLYGRPVVHLSRYGDFTSPENERGLPMKFVRLEGGVASRFTIPEHMAGWRDPETVAAHPGVVDTALSTAMGRGALFNLQRAVRARSFSVEYFDLVPVGVEVRVEATQVGEREGEVVMEAQLLGEKGELLAKSFGAFDIFAPEVLEAKCAPEFLDPFEQLIQ